MESQARQSRSVSERSSAGAGLAPAPEAARHILVADNRKALRMLCRINFEAAGMTVTEARDGQEVLALAPTTRPDLVLLDVVMPRVDGWQVAQKLLADPATKEIPIVFLTARAKLEDRARGLELGGIDYVTKPFNPVELTRRIEHVIDRVERGERENVRKEAVSRLRLQLSLH